MITTVSYKDFELLYYLSYDYHFFSFYDRVMLHKVILNYEKSGNGDGQKWKEDYVDWGKTRIVSLKLKPSMETIVVISLPLEGANW